MKVLYRSQTRCLGLSEVLFAFANEEGGLCNDVSTLRGEHAKMTLTMCSSGARASCNVGEFLKSFCSGECFAIIRRICARRRKVESCRDPNPREQKRSLTNGKVADTDFYAAGACIDPHLQFVEHGTITIACRSIVCLGGFEPIGFTNVLGATVAT